MSPWPITLTLPNETDTVAFAQWLVPLLRAGDTLLLDGPIGAGKSTFARALVRAALQDPAAEVPSPTFTLVQTYEAPGLQIWHADLYRLNGPAAVPELGLDGAFDSALVLVEWPDRLGSLAPPGALQLAFAAGDMAHTVTLSGDASWVGRLAGLA